MINCRKGCTLVQTIIFKMNINNLRKLRALLLLSTRKEMKMTQERMAELSGLSRATIVRLESGKNSCNQDSELIYLETLKNKNDLA